MGSKVFKRLDPLRRMGLVKDTMKIIADMKKFDVLIDGELRPARSQQLFKSINPSTGEPFAQLADCGVKDMQEAVQAARRAFDSGPWPSMSPAERGIYLKRVAKLIWEHAAELAALETADTGKTIKQTTFIDVPTCADTFDYFSNVAEEFEGRSLKINAPVKSSLLRDPMGVVGCIIPWNYPLIMAAWKIAPALIAGNTVVFKPSSSASVSVMRLAQLVREADLPKGVLNFVTGRNSEIGSALVQSPDVDMISFTGGTATGQEIMRLAAGTTKKLSLELGGKSPNIVLADCDLEAALGGTMSAIFMNQGQMCTAGSRLLVQDKIYDQFLQKLMEKTQNLKIGPAMNYETDFGPLIGREHRDKVLSFVEIGKKEGARLLCGGKIPVVADGIGGFYLEPAIFTDVRNSMTIAREEIFGPVLSVIRFSEIEEAIAIANDSPYGLAAMVWTKNTAKAQEIGRRLRCGTVWINTYGGFYNEAPFGGFKRSGFGRELGHDGLLEYTQTKHICQDSTPGGRPLVSCWF